MGVCSSLAHWDQPATQAAALQERIDAVQLKNNALQQDCIEVQSSAAEVKSLSRWTLGSETLFPTRLAHRALTARKYHHRIDTLSH